MRALRLLSLVSALGTASGFGSFGSQSNVDAASHVANVVMEYKLAESSGLTEGAPDPPVHLSKLAVLRGRIMIDDELLHASTYSADGDTLKWTRSVGAFEEHGEIYFTAHGHHARGRVTYDTSTGAGNGRRLQDFANISVALVELTGAIYFAVHYEDNGQLMPWATFIYGSVLAGGGGYTLGGTLTNATAINNWNMSFYATEASPPPSPPPSSADDSGWGTMDFGGLTSPSPPHHYASPAALEARIGPGSFFTTNEYRNDLASSIGTESEEFCTCMFTSCMLIHSKVFHASVQFKVNSGLFNQHGYRWIQAELEWLLYATTKNPTAGYGFRVIGNLTEYTTGRVFPLYGTSFAPSHWTDMVPGLYDPPVPNSRCATTHRRVSSQARRLQASVPGVPLSVTDLYYTTLAPSKEVEQRAQSTFRELMLKAIAVHEPDWFDILGISEASLSVSSTQLTYLNNQTYVDLLVNYSKSYLSKVASSRELFPRCCSYL